MINTAVTACVRSCLGSLGQASRVDVDDVPYVWESRGRTDMGCVRVRRNYCDDSEWETRGVPETTSVGGLYQRWLGTGGWCG